MNKSEAATQPSASRQTSIILPRQAEPGLYDTFVNEPPKAKKYAVFVAHGMGQQKRYETLDQVAQGLIEVEEDTGKKRADITIEPPVVTIKTAYGVLHGLRLRLAGEEVQEREVHLFEGYWAPLVEGQVKLRDVIRFLFFAGLSGLRNFGEQFDRWLFGEYRKFRSHISLTLCLLIALAVVASLVVMDTAILAIAAQALVAKSGLLAGADWQWLEDLKGDLTVTYDIFILLAILLTGTLLAGAKSRRLAVEVRKDQLKITAKLKTAKKERIRRIALKLSRSFNLISWALFALTIGATILCGVTIPLLFYAHKRGPRLETGFWAQAFGLRFVNWLNDGLSYLFVGLLAVIVTYLIVGGTIQFLAAMRRVDKNSLKVLIGTVVVLALVGIVVFKLAIAVYHSWAMLGQFWVEAFLKLKDNISWVLLVAVTLWIRRVLVQYVGDVALYIDSHTLDRFHNLRDKIREDIAIAARAVYACRSTESGQFDYDGVFIVGHSLGSVIAYETLNRLLNEDIVAAEHEKLDVLDRTKLLLTIGSPLDKIAFLFSMQRERTSLEREALAAASQPLILDTKFRKLDKFEWINIFSTNDIISGKLDFFDPPTRSKTRKLINPVRNIRDEEATTLLFAHVEYWDNQLVFRKLHEKLTEKAQLKAEV